MDERAGLLETLRALTLRIAEPSRGDDPPRAYLEARLSARLAHLRAQQPELEPVLTEVAEVLDGLPESPEAADGARLAAAYDRLRAAMAAKQVLGRSAPRRITAPNLARSLFHALTGLFAALAYRYVVAFPQAAAIAVSASLLGLVLEGSRRRFEGLNRRFMALPFVRRVSRPDEYRRLWSSTQFAWGVTLAVMTTSPIAVQVACVVLALGDPAAGLVGRRWPLVPLVDGKSLGGMLAFVGVGSGAALAYLGLTADLPPPEAARLGISAAMAGAVAELCSKRLDDNLTIPAVAAWAAELARSIA